MHAYMYIHMEISIGPPALLLADKNMHTYTNISMHSRTFIRVKPRNSNRMTEHAAPNSSHLIAASHILSN